MTSEVCRSVMFGLSHCLHLKQLNLFNSPLTDCLGTLFGNSSNQFIFLETLYVKRTKLSNDDIANVQLAIQLRKLLKLKELDLSDNSVTGCIGVLFGNHSLFN